MDFVLNFKAVMPIRKLFFLNFLKKNQDIFKMP